MLYEVTQRAVAHGYVRAKAATSGKGRSLRFDSLGKALDRVPGYDKTLVPKRRRR